jgi:hypothetical protein
MEPEQRMIMAALLLSIAQQRAENVQWLGVSPSKVKVLSDEIAYEARLFVNSEAFDEMCEAVDLPAQAMWEMDPDEALKAYKKLTSDKWSKH